MWIWIIIFIVALVALIKGSNWFTDASEEIGLWMGLSPFLIGVTIVSIGTSLPELASSIAAVLKGSSDIVLGNVVGSNIANTLFVLGLAALITDKLKTKKFSKDIIIVGAVSLLILIFSINGIISLIESIILIGLFITYLIYVLKGKKVKTKKHKITWKAPVILIIGILFVTLGAKFLIDAVIIIATNLGVSSAVIGATAVAFGTSLPEAFVTITACLRGKKNIAIGNIIGSNIFNILAITGIAGLFGKLIVETTVLVIALPTLIIATIILWWVTKNKSISRIEGVVMLIIYIAYSILVFL